MPDKTSAPVRTTRSGPASTASSVTSARAKTSSASASTASEWSGAALAAPFAGASAVRVLVRHAVVRRAKVVARGVAQQVGHAIAVDARIALDLLAEARQFRFRLEG